MKKNEKSFYDYFTQQEKKDWNTRMDCADVLDKEIQNLERKRSRNTKKLVLLFEKAQQRMKEADIK